MNQNVIKTLTIRAVAEGVDQTTASMNKLKDAHGNLAKVTDEQSKRTLSVEKSYQSLQRRYDAEFRAQQDLAKVQRQLDSARAQGLVTQERASQLMQAAIKHHNGAAGAASLHGRALQGLAAQAQGLAGNLGSIGSVLAGMGPAALAAAAAVGAVAIAFKAAADAALQLAERAGKLKDFSETTGFTVTQIQALEQAGSQVGVSAESVSKGLERFSVVMDDVKQSTGAVYEAIRQIDPELARQISRTENLAEAWDLLAEASRKADLEQRNKLARQVFGRSGIEQTRLLGASAEAGGLSGLVAQLKEVDRITDQQAKSWDELGDAIALNMKIGKENITATFAGDVLAQILKFSEGFKELSRIIKTFDWSGVQTFLGFLTPALQAINPLLPPFVLAWRAIKALAPEGGGGAPLKIEVNADAFSAAEAAARKSREEITRNANEMKRWMDILGDAATPAEKLAFKQLELAAAAIKAGVSQEYANRAFRQFKEEMESRALSARISMLGDLATTQEVVAAKQRAINEANRDGAKITDEETAAILRKTAAMHEAQQLPNQLQFEQSQIFRDPVEQTVAARMRAEHGADYEKHMQSAEASIVRQNYHLQQGKDLLESAASGFISDLAKGVTLMDAIANAAGKLGQTLIDIGTKQIIGDLMAALKGGGSGGGLSGILGGGSSGGGWRDAFAQAVPSIGTWDPGGAFDERFNAAFGSASKLLTDGATSAGQQAITAATTAAITQTTASTTAATALQAGGVSAETSMATGGAAAGQALAGAGAVGGGGGGGGLLGGLLGGAGGMSSMLGPAMAIGGFALSMFSASKQREKAEQQRIEQAKKAWEDARFAAETFKASLEGRSMGTLLPSIEEKRAETSRYANLAHAAMGGNAQSNPEVIALQNAFAAYAQRITQDFVKSFGDVVVAFKSGLGPESPIFRGTERIKEIGNSLKDFIADTEFVTKGHPIEQVTIWMDEARKSTQMYALALLDTVKPLSATSEKLLELQGAAKNLPALLVELGMSAEEAAAAVQQHLNVAIQDLTKSFTDSLQAQLNDAKGKGYINEISNLVNELVLNASTLTQLGQSQLLAWQVFEAEAQQVIDDAELTGADFAALVAMFPNLANVMVHEFDGIADAIKRTAAEIAEAKQSFQDQLFTELQDQNTIAGRLAVFDLQAQRQREAEVKAGGEALADLEALLAVQRLNIIKEFNDHAIEEQKRVAEEAQKFWDGMKRQISQFITQQRTGSQSPLLPIDRLAAAKTAFNAEFALAQTGDRDALSNITSSAQTLIEAARDVFQSAPQFQTIFEQTLAKLGVLPDQVKPEDLIVDAIETAATQTITAIDAMRIAIVPALQAGGATAAAALATYFNQLDSSLDGLLSAQEFFLGLKGLASQQTLQQMFATLDANGDGQLSRLELINAATGQTAVGVAVSNAQLNALNNTVRYLRDINIHLSIIEAILHAGNPIDLTSVYNAVHAQELNAAYQNANAIFTAQVLALRDSAWAAVPGHAAGGMVSGVGTGTSDSNLRRLSVGEFVMPATQARANMSSLESMRRGGRGANDNEMAQEIRALRAEVSALRATVRDAGLHVGSRVDAAADRNEGGQIKLVDETRHRRNQPEGHGGASRRRSARS